MTDGRDDANAREYESAQRAAADAAATITKIEKDYRTAVRADLAALLKRHRGKPGVSVLGQSMAQVAGLRELSSRDAQTGWGVRPVLD